MLCSLNSNLKRKGKKLNWFCWWYFLNAGLRQNQFKSNNIMCMHSHMFAHTLMYRIQNTKSNLMHFIHSMKAPQILLLTQGVLLSTVYHHILCLREIFLPLIDTLQSERNTVFLAFLPVKGTNSLTSFIYVLINYQVPNEKLSKKSRRAPGS